MTDIAKTLIGTNNVPTITNGVPLYENLHFPSGWSKHFDSVWWDTTTEHSIQVENFKLKILDGRFSTRFACNAEFGLAGPSWAGRMEVEGTATKNHIQLDILEDDFKAGMLIGANFNIQFTLQAQAYNPIPFHRGWFDVVNIEKDSNTDLVQLLFSLANFLKAAGKLIPGVEKILVLIPSANLNLIANNSGIHSYVSDPDAFLDWLWIGLTMSPDLQLEWDLISIIETLAVTAADVTPLAPFSELVSEALAVSSWLIPTLASGPVVGAAFEVHLKISGLTGYTEATGSLEAHPTRNLNSTGSVMHADFIDTSSDKQIDYIGVNFTHRASISLELGWHTSLYWFKIIGHDFVKTWQASDFLGIGEVPVSEQYKYELLNKTGKTTDESGIKITLKDSWVFSEN